MSRRSRVKPVANLRSSVRKRPNLENTLNEDKEDENQITIFEENSTTLDQFSEAKIVEEQIRNESCSKEDTNQQADESNNNDTFKKPQTKAEAEESENNNNEANATQNSIQNKSRLRLKKIQPRLGITRNSSNIFSHKAVPTETISEKSPKITSQFSHEKISREEKDSEISHLARLEDVQNNDRSSRNLPDTQNNDKETSSSSSSATPNSSTLASPFNFPHPPPSRIRTESLCSIKSNFSGIGGVVRKNFRSEENQRIIDTKRESKVRLSNKNLDKTQLLMFDMIYYNPTSNPMKISDKNSPKRDRSRSATPVVEIPEKPKEPEITEPSNCLVPQVKLGPNGEMILDEKSLVVENEQQKKSRILLANANVVYDDELSGAYGYYKRQKRTREWLPEETVKFYRCLHTIGTDFSLMLQLFPDRSRRDLKLKFKKEEKNNLALINKALMHPNTFDIDELKKNLEYDDLMRKKDSENKMKAEVNAKLKKEILKKQASVVKVRKKSKVDRMLTDAETASQIVDGVLLTNDNNESKTRREMSEVTNLTKEPPTKRPKRHSKKTNVVDSQTTQLKSTDLSVPDASNVHPQAYLIELATETPPILIDFPESNTIKASKIDLNQNNTPIDGNLSTSHRDRSTKNDEIYEVTRVGEDMDVDYSCNSNIYYELTKSDENSYEKTKQNSTSTMVNLNPQVDSPSTSTIQTISEFVPQSINTQDLHKHVEEFDVIPETQKVTQVTPSTNTKKGSKKIAPKLQQRKNTTKQNDSKSESNVPLNQFPGSSQESYVTGQFNQYPRNDSYEPSQCLGGTQNQAFQTQKMYKMEAAGIENSVIISNDRVNYPVAFNTIDPSNILPQDMPEEFSDPNVLNLHSFCDRQAINSSEPEHENIPHHLQRSNLESSFDIACDIGQSSFSNIRANEKFIESQDQQEIYKCDFSSIKNRNLFDFEHQQMPQNRRIQPNLEDQINVNDFLPTFSNNVKFEGIDQNDKIILEAPLVILSGNENKSITDINLNEQSSLMKNQNQTSTFFKTTVQSHSGPENNDTSDSCTNSEQLEKDATSAIPSVSGIGSKNLQKNNDEKSQDTTKSSENQEEESDDDYYDNLLNDIDLNSLVMVESQVDNELIHEIYIMDPVTEQLSEKPLDLPADIIENIRRVLNSEENNE